MNVIRGTPSLERRWRILSFRTISFSGRVVHPWTLLEILGFCLVAWWCVVHFVRYFFEQEILFLFEKFVRCFLCPCVCAPRAWSPRVIRVDTLSHGQRDSKSLLWDLRIDRKTWLLQVERYFTCKAVLNYYYSVPMCSLVYHHFFLFLTEREIYLKGTYLMMELRRLYFISSHHLL